jgi:hypothetical protein
MKVVWDPVGAGPVRAASGLHSVPEGRLIVARRFNAGS